MTRMHLPPSPRPHLRAWVLALALAGSAVAFAAAPGGPVQYRWRDAQGNLHFSDTLSTVAIARGYDVVNAQGVVVQHVPSPAERRAEQAAAAAQAKLDAARAHQQARDARLLAAYPHESDLRQALPIALPAGRGDGSGWQLLPDEDALDGMFYARIGKRDSG